MLFRLIDEEVGDGTPIISGVTAGVDAGESEGVEIDPVGKGYS